MIHSHLCFNIFANLKAPVIFMCICKIQWYGTFAGWHCKNIAVY